MERLDEKLPNLRHCFQGAAPQRIGVYGHPTPDDDAEVLGVRGDFNGWTRFVNDGRRKKCKTDGEHFRQVDSLLLSAGAEKGLRKRSEQTGAVAAGSVRVDASTVGKAF